MAIDTVDKLIAALGNSAQAFVVNKVSIANQLAGGFSSMWRATGTPAQGAIPTTAAICARGLTGSFQYNNATGGASSYLGRAFLVSSIASTDVQWRDRLGHRGGLVGNVATAQTVDLDVSGTSNNLVARRGAADYSDVDWFVEIYTDIGTTGATCTVTYTNADGVTGRTTTLTVGGASPANRAGRLLPIIGNAGEFIQSIQSVQLSVTTGTAGNWGITATRLLSSMSLGNANAGEVYDWQMLGLPKIEDDACPFVTLICGSTSTGNLIGSAKLIQG